MLPYIPPYIKGGLSPIHEFEIYRLITRMTIYSSRQSSLHSVLHRRVSTRKYDVFYSVEIFSPRERTGLVRGFFEGEHKARGHYRNEYHVGAVFL